MRVIVTTRIQQRVLWGAMESSILRQALPLFSAIGAVVCAATAAFSSRLPPTQDPAMRRSSAIARATTTTPASRRPKARPFLASPGALTWVPVDEAICRDGSPTGFFAKFSDSSRDLMIYLEGGGSCFNPITCENSAHNIQERVTGETMDSIRAVKVPTSLGLPGYSIRRGPPTR